MDSELSVAVDPTPVKHGLGALAEGPKPAPKKNVTKAAKPKMKVAIVKEKKLSPEE